MTAYGPADALPPRHLCFKKSRMVFRCRPTRVVLEKWPLNDCVCVFLSSSLTMYCSPMCCDLLVGYLSGRTFVGEKILLQKCFFCGGTWELTVEKLLAVVLLSSSLASHVTCC